MGEGRDRRGVERGGDEQEGVSWCRDATVRGSCLISEWGSRVCAHAYSAWGKGKLREIIENIYIYHILLSLPYGYFSRASWEEGQVGPLFRQLVKLPFCPTVGILGKLKGQVEN